MSQKFLTDNISSIKYISRPLNFLEATCVIQNFIATMEPKIQAQECGHRKYLFSLQGQGLQCICSLSLLKIHCFRMPKSLSKFIALGKNLWPHSVRVKLSQLLLYWVAVEKMGVILVLPWPWHTMLHWSLGGSFVQPKTYIICKGSLIIGISKTLIVGTY